MKPVLGQCELANYNTHWRRCKRYAELPDIYTQLGTMSWHKTWDKAWNTPKDTVQKGKPSSSLIRHVFG